MLGVAHLAHVGSSCGSWLWSTWKQLDFFKLNCLSGYLPLKYDLTTMLCCAYRDQCTVVPSLCLICAEQPAFFDGFVSSMFFVMFTSFNEHTAAAILFLDDHNTSIYLIDAVQPYASSVQGNIEVTNQKVHHKQSSSGHLRTFSMALQRSKNSA